MFSFLRVALVMMSLHSNGNPQTVVPEFGRGRRGRWVEIILVSGESVGFEWSLERAKLGERNVREDRSW